MGEPRVPESVLTRVLSEIRRVRSRGPRPTLVALDGASGSGKTTLGRAIAAATDVIVVPGDDFYAAEVTHAEWQRLGPAERAERAIDWQRLRAEALEPLLQGKPARWHRIDFKAGERDDGTYSMRDESAVLNPANVIVCDGAYSARPELADIVDLSVLVDVPIEIRHARLATREDADFLLRWHARWDEAEHHYFTQVRPRSAFDLVIPWYDAPD